MSSIRKIISHIVVYLCLTVQLNDGLRILGIFPFHIRSKYVMGEELFKALAAKGHQVDVYSHFPLTKPVRNYHDFSLQGSLPNLTNNRSYTDALDDNYVTITINSYDAFTGPLCNLLGHEKMQKLIHNPPNDPPYDLVITEFGMVHCFIPFGRHLKVPVIGLQPQPLLAWQYEGFGNPLNPAVDPNLLTSYVAPMPFLERLNNFIVYKHLTWLFNGYARLQDEYVEKYFGPGFPTTMELLKDVSLILVNDDATLYGAKAFVPKVVPVAGLHMVKQNQTLAREVQKWLDESTNGCILFTFGSTLRIETFPNHVIQAFYKSFEKIAPVRVLMKIVQTEDLPPGLPNNVLTQPWFEQGAVLKHKNIRAFVTHGGIMGTQEAIYHEVPMIGIPMYYDQFFTINAYVKKNVAIKLSLTELNETLITMALSEVLENPLYKKNAIKIGKKFKDRPVDIMDTAIFWVEYIHRHGKDALKSAVEDMPWWQATMLDVYAVLTLTVVVALYTSVKVIKIMMNQFIRSIYGIKVEKLKRH